MSGPLRILYVDDYPLDRELVRDALETEPGAFTLVTAATRAEFEARLAGRGYDLVLSDFNILGFEGLQVLETVHAHNPDLPVVIVTGTGSEEVAAEAIKRGAADYVLKSPRHIQHLPQTIHAVLEKQRLTLERAQARAEAETERDRLTLLMDNLPDTLCFKDRQARYTRANRALARQFGLDDPAALLGKTEFELLPSESARARLAQELGLLESGQSLVDLVEFSPRPDGTARWLSTTTVPTRDSAGAITGLVSIARDITGRKQAEQALERQLQRLAALRQIDQAIMASFDLHLVLNILLEQAAEQLHADAIDVLLYEPQSRLLLYEAGRGFRTDANYKARVRLGEDLAGRVAAERRVLRIPDLSAASPAVRARLPASEGFTSYVGAPLLVKGEIKGALEVFQRARFDPAPDWLEFLDTLTGQAAIAIDNAQLFAGLQRSNLALALAYDATIEGWSRALDLRDNTDPGHTERLTEITLRLARALGLAEVDLVHVRRGVLLHDIGQMSVPDSILLKPGPLTEAEWVVMRGHPQAAYELLSPITYLRPALDVPYAHHEKWDGSGYPRGLKGEEIPHAARVFAVVDVWDALISHRPYRAAWSDAQARAYLREQAGQHFDPRAVEAFLNLAGEYGHA